MSDLSVAAADRAACLIEASQARSERRLIFNVGVDSALPPLHHNEDDAGPFEEPLDSRAVDAVLLKVDLV